MLTTLTGKAAEAAVANYLTSQGYKIIDHNWRTRVCEIDLVAQKKKVIYFIEVKYRGSQAQGDGLEYIGRRKLGQLEFAAKVWCQNHDWNDDYQLLGAEVSGTQFETIEIVEIN